ncbi:brix domain-containing protein [Ditylenchus destructor]|uniref:Ribosome biogenesis protein BRX1 homolog n=1 Tax=Ditylenchus destructor TaxID=166010 RepID=A0AAD4NF03_9BILA|nr:brix domain-containing protein [Ditylenchus destructor]
MKGSADASEWTDRERVLLLCSRGCMARTRHIMNDFKQLMPHVRSEAKFEKGNGLENLNEISELANCAKCIYLENRKCRDVYMWISRIDGGPSAKFLVHNMHTMNELSLAGNCLKGSRPILSFDSQFDSQPHFKVIKELLSSVFKTPNKHPKSQPFIDHVLNFSITNDGNIWFRNYQIVDNTLQLEEIGPRMVLEVIRIFDGSFHGSVLYDNPDYKPPNSIRRELKLQKATEFSQKQEQKESAKIKDAMVKNTIAGAKELDPVGELFDTNSKAAKDSVGVVLDRMIVKKKRRKSKGGNKNDAKSKKPRTENV